MYFTPRVRAVSDDKRLTQKQIKSLLAKTSLSPVTRTAVTNAFFEDGMLADGNIKAAAAKVENDGRHSVKSVDKALVDCSVPLSIHALIEIKNVLMRHSLI
jgi:hypothetical protein